MVSRSAARETTRIHFITNKRASFDLSWKKNLVKRRNAPQHLHDCLKAFLFIFMSLSAAEVLKPVVFRLKFTSSFQKMS